MTLNCNYKEYIHHFQDQNRKWHLIKWNNSNYKLWSTTGEWRNSIVLSIICILLPSVAIVWTKGGLCIWAWVTSIVSNSFENVIKIVSCNEQTKHTIILVLFRTRVSCKWSHWFSCVTIPTTNLTIHSTT